MATTEEIGLVRHRESSRLMDGQRDRERGGRAGVRRSEKHVLQFLLQLLPSDGVDGERQTARQEDSTSQPVDSITGRRVGGKSHGSSP